MLEVRFWRAVGKSDEMERSIRIKRKIDANTIVESHKMFNANSNIDVITLERTDNQSPYYRVLWAKPNYIPVENR